MKKLLFAGMLYALCTASAQATLITVDLDGTGSGTFADLGTATATYSESGISIENNVTGGNDLYDMVVTITGVGGTVESAGLTGLGVNDGFVDVGELLQFDVNLTAVDPATVIEDFEFQILNHGATIGTVSLTDLAFGSGSLLNPTGPTGFQASFPGQTFSVNPFPGSSPGPPLPTTPDGSVGGITGFTFEVTSVPEPSSAIACGLLLCVGVLRRRRKSELLA